MDIPDCSYNIGIACRLRKLPWSHLHRLWGDLGPTKWNHGRLCRM